MGKNSPAFHHMGLLLLLCILLAPVVGASAQTISSPPRPPSGINQDDHDRLQRRKASLDAMRQALEADIGALNADCSRVPAADSSRASSCRKRQTDLLARIGDYRSAVDAYTWQVQLVSLLSPTALANDDALHSAHPLPRELQRSLQRVVDLERNLRRIQGRLKGLTQTLRASTAEFETWKGTVDEAVNDTWRNGLEYLLSLPFEYGTYKLGTLLKKRLQEIEKQSVRSADLLASTSDPTRREQYRAVRQWLAREEKLARYNLRQLDNLGALKTNYDLREWNTKRADDYDSLVDGLGWMAGIIAPPFSHLKMSAQAYSNVVAECVSWYRINSLTRQNEEYAAQVRELSRRMERDMGELGCLKGCLREYRDGCLTGCGSGSSLHMPPPLLD
ncbi:hypothetical protein [Pelobacter propionicus]|uniref:Uncharacterized protein n=1 Tax=Pelobacter propionicus (strain DSM 2379 / NBRC 103807 / OttBd1) TaxID=338966 RepID=A1ARA6_PELPD|nr:hypothetical protein [Pelobacter propionicus]ABK99876.1 hypothetical protein Ppro_2269 [Pelobacter propionicus DSM 2379]